MDEGESHMVDGAILAKYTLEILFSCIVAQSADEKCLVCITLHIGIVAWLVCDNMLVTSL